jgi:hypothetical protein
MTINSTVRTAGPFQGDGSTVSYQFGFKVFQDSDLLVTRVDETTNAPVELALSVDYTVTLNANQDTAPGGTVTLTTPLAATQSLSMTSDVVPTQGASIPNMGGFYPKVIEAALDRLTILAQQSQITAQGGLRAAYPDTLSELPNQGARANRMPIFGLTGDAGVSAFTVDQVAAAIAAVSPGGTGGTVVGREVVTVQSDGQTVINLASVRYTPGVSAILVVVDGKLLPQTDYTQTSSSSITMSTGLNAGMEVEVIAARMVTAGVDGAQVSVTQTGSGTAGRTLTARAGDARNINDYTGADSTGAGDSSAAALSYKNYVEGESFNVVGTGREPMVFPPGVYQLSAQQFNKVGKVKGAGSKNTFIVLKPGETGPLFTVNAEDVAGTSVDDANHFSVEGVTLVGNRTDSTTVGTSHAIYCPDAPWAIGTQYSPSIRGSDVVILNFTGDGLYFGVNRNWALLDRVIVRYCNDSALVTYGYDGRYTSCDFGVCQNYGVRELAGGANVYLGCNIYYNTINVVVDPFSNAASSWIACAIDGALQNGASIAAGAAAKKFIGGRFFGNSRAGAGLYSDIKTAAEIHVIGTDFIMSGQKVKLLLETNGTKPPVIWLPSYIDTSGGAATPYLTDITDDWTILRYAGGSDARLGAAGISTLSAYIGSTERLRVDANGLSIRSPFYMLSSLAALTNSAGAQTGTLTNSPVAGNPTKWIPINDNGTTRYIPAW